VTLNEVKLNFGREATYASEDGTVTEQGEIRGVWGDSVQFLIGNGHLRLIPATTLTLVNPL
jgi:hypothetical protein